jgi:hypothetical protein
MSKPPTVAVTQSELDDVFDALGLWDKIRDGQISSDHIPRARLPSGQFRGGISDIVRHYNRLGYHVATTHRITMPDGTTPHWDAKDLHIGNVVIFAE